MHHQLLQLLSLILLQLTLLPWAAVGENSQPYCYRNVTETTYKVITKTRLKNVSSKNFFRKITFKKDTQIEIYEDQEPVYKIKLERICCEGYKLSELDMCEPQCVQNGCPPHSKCIEPEVCECLKGYFSMRSAHDGKHYCEPICEKPCPANSACVAPNECACHKGYHLNGEMQCKPYCASGCPYEGVCIAPNMCSCQEGYKSEKGSCLAVCSLGDQCQNGKCVAKDRCICNGDYSWNSETFKCEQDYMETSTYYPDSTEEQQTTESRMEVETDIDSSNDDIDPNQVFDEIISGTTFYVTDNEDDSSTRTSVKKPTKCPEDYVYHKGECLPLKFASTEIDCWSKPCLAKHTVCLENGTCACSEGYQLFKDHHMKENNSSNHTSTFGECLSAAEYQARILNLKEDPQREPVEKSINWTMIFFIVLGVFVILSALIYLGIKLLTKQTGRMDVEGKNLSCTYTNRPRSETEKSAT